MFILSQDKMCLSEVSGNLIIKRIDIPVKWYIDKDGINLGKYSTEERAKEVLGEIMEKLSYYGKI